MNLVLSSKPKTCVHIYLTPKITFLHLHFIALLPFDAFKLHLYPQVVLCSEIAVEKSYKPIPASSGKVSERGIRCGQLACARGLNSSEAQDANPQGYDQFCSTQISLWQPPEDIPDLICSNGIKLYIIIIMRHLLCLFSVSGWTSGALNPIKIYV